MIHQLALDERTLRILHAATTELVMPGVRLTLVGFTSQKNVGTHKQFHQALLQLVNAGLLCKTGPHTRREYALTPAGLDQQQHTTKPKLRPLLPICRMCGHARHWRECPLHPKGAA